MAKNETAAVPAAGKGTAAPAYTRDQLAASRRYAGRRDLVRALLEDGRRYTLAEADGKIEAFRKGGVS